MIAMFGCQHNGERYDCVDCLLGGMDDDGRG